MPINLYAGDVFPDFELPDHRKKPRRLSSFTKPSPMDEKLGFTDGYPVILIFGRGFFCPRDQQHMRQLVHFQSELTVNFGKLVTVSTDAPLVGAAFRAGLGAQWPFLSDERREVIKRIGILDETEGEYAYVARPYTFVLRSDLTIHKVYDGWFFVGRPTLEELRHDLRDIMRSRSDYHYEAHNTPEAKKIASPSRSGQTAHRHSGRTACRWRKAWCAPSTSMLASERSKATPRRATAFFFNFTAIPGEGYRTLRPGTPVSFELVENETGPTARNVQKDGES